MHFRCPAGCIPLALVQRSQLGEEVPPVAFALAHAARVRERFNSSGLAAMAALPGLGEAAGGQAAAEGGAQPIEAPSEQASGAEGCSVSGAACPCLPACPRPVPLSRFGLQAMAANTACRWRAWAQGPAALAALPMLSRLQVPEVPEDACPLSLIKQDVQGKPG